MARFHTNQFARVIPKYCALRTSNETKPVAERRFPPAWSIENNGVCFIVHGAKLDEIKPPNWGGFHSSFPSTMRR
jgi:hypothetical protein